MKIGQVLKTFAKDYNRKRSSMAIFTGTGQLCYAQWSGELGFELAEAGSEEVPDEREQGTCTSRLCIPNPWKEESVRWWRKEQVTAALKGLQKGTLEALAIIG